MNNMLREAIPKKSISPPFNTLYLNNYLKFVEKREKLLRKLAKLRPLKVKFYGSQNSRKGSNAISARSNKYKIYIGVKKFYF